MDGPELDEERRSHVFQWSRKSVVAVTRGEMGDSCVERMVRVYASWTPH